MGQREFADRLGVSQSFISAMESGKKLLPPDLAEKIIDEFGVNRRWLKIGKGEPWGDNQMNQIDCIEKTESVGPKVGFYRDLILFLGGENIQGTPNEDQETWLRGEIGKIRREIAEYYTRALKIKDLAKYGGATLFVMLDKWDFGPIESIYLEFVKGENPDSSDLITYAQRAKNALYDLQTQFFALFDEYARQLQKRFDKSFQAYLEAEKEPNQQQPQGIQQKNV